MTKWILIGVGVVIFIALVVIGVDALKCTAPCV
ncbi:uncharacterized protein METZ01_LOCUS142104 [marine metagenome]|uniref:Uncharacterized protein n=1 Tax=marine metagenome TaxID=408172 RepID=A0A381ZJ28_9ZZZZ